VNDSSGHGTLGEALGNVDEPVGEARPIIPTGESPLDVPFARPVYAAPSWPSDPLLLHDETRRNTWADLGWFLVLGVVIELLINAAVKVVATVWLNVPPDPSDEVLDELKRKILVPTIAARAGGWIVAIRWLLRRRGQGFRSVGLSTWVLPLNLVIGLLILVVAYGMIGVTMYTIWMLWPDIEDPGENARRIMAFIPKLKPWQFVPLAALIGIYEELIFRGFLMPRLRRALGGWTLAVILTTTVFTALHAIEQTRAALIVVAILSLIFSLVTIWRRSIVPAIVAHGLFNLSQFLLLYWFAGKEWS